MFVRSCVQPQTGKDKDAEKHRVKVQRADAAAVQADQQYQEAIAALEEARVLWEREMVPTLEVDLT
jgi:hypothetical protein